MSSSNIRKVSPVSSSTQVAMLKDFRKDEDLVKKTFSVHAGVVNARKEAAKPS